MKTERKIIEKYVEKAYEDISIAQAMTAAISSENDEKFKRGLKEDLINIQNLLLLFINKL